MKMNVAGQDISVGFPDQCKVCCCCCRMHLGAKAGEPGDGNANARYEKYH